MGLAIAPLLYVRRTSERPIKPPISIHIGGHGALVIPVIIPDKRAPLALANEQELSEVFKVGSGIARERD